MKWQRKLTIICFNQYCYRQYIFLILRVTSLIEKNHVINLTKLMTLLNQFRINQTVK